MCVVVETVGVVAVVVEVVGVVLCVVVLVVVGAECNLPVAWSGGGWWRWREVRARSLLFLSNKGNISRLSARIS